MTLGHYTGDNALHNKQTFFAAPPFDVVFFVDVVALGLPASAFLGAAAAFFVVAALPFAGAAFLVVAALLADFEGGLAF
jgi:hypothetical protein